MWLGFYALLEPLGQTVRTFYIKIAALLVEQAYRAGHGGAGPYNAFRQGIQGSLDGEIQGEVGGYTRESSHALFEQLLCSHLFGDIVRNGA